MNKLFIISILVLFSTSIFAQAERSSIRKGNDAYKEGNYKAAAAKYEKALKENSAETNVYKNVGAANFKSDEFDKSVNAYNEYLRSNIDDKQKAEAYYNLGNTYLQNSKYSESVEAYRNALKLDPKHDKSRHNMAVATKILQQQQNQQQQQEQNQNQDKQQDQQQQEQQQEQNKDDKQDKNDQQQQEQQEQDMSREEMKRYLDQLNQKEKETQEKVQEAQKGKKRDLEKNW